MFGKFIISLIILQIFIKCGQSDYYSSYTQLEGLLNIEKFFVKNFEEFIRAEHTKNDYLRKYLRRTGTELEEASSNPTSYFGNPFKAWKTIKRLTKDWQNHFSALSTLSSEEHFVEILRMHQQHIPLPKPSMDDLLGAAKGVARLQKTYNLMSSHLANGTIGNRKVSTEMTAADCYDLGVSLLTVKDFKNAATWLMESRAKLAVEAQYRRRPNVRDFPYLREEMVLKQLTMATVGTGNTKLAIWLTKELLKLNPQNAQAAQSLERLGHQLNNERSNMIKPSIKAPRTNRENLMDWYERTCRGELKRTPTEERNLRCRYIDNKVPFCRIAPYKEEILSYDPFVAVYHDVIYDTEIKRIINSAKHKVARSKTGGTKYNSVSDIRTSQNTWLYYHENDFLTPIAYRLRDITGLSLASSEPLQLATYGIGGHYGPHFDFFEDDDSDFQGRGNRILTAMFYLNDIELGGGTAFPYLRILVPSKKGSLLVWYNLHDSLEFDYRTKHAGCPVALGTKWICNEWFHTVGQEFLHPCGLRPEGYKSIEFKKLDSTN